MHRFPYPAIPVFKTNESTVEPINDSYNPTKRSSIPDEFSKTHTSDNVYRKEELTKREVNCKTLST